ncbi:MAG: phosphate/phosphite/phosphonate ABC transporter substrate-binding protein, partial [Boseongicola sp.]
DLIRGNLGSEVQNAPVKLTRGGDLWEQWQSKDLLLSQTCGLPYRKRLHGKVSLVGTPVFDLECEPGHYYSIVVARKNDGREALHEFADAVIAVNGWDSQSGWAAPQNFAADHGIAFQKVHISGAHRASALAVANGVADIAALDAVTWKMLCRYDEFVQDLKEIAQTPPTPALPYISAKSRDTDDFPNAISIAIGKLTPEDRETLCLKGLTAIPTDQYLAVPTPQPLE